MAKSIALQFAFIFEELALWSITSIRVGLKRTVTFRIVRTELFQTEMVRDSSSSMEPDGSSIAVETLVAPNLERPEPRSAADFRLKGAILIAHSIFAPLLERQ